jgi:hypothetical protein
MTSAGSGHNVTLAVNGRLWTGVRGVPCGGQSDCAPLALKD